MALRFIDPSSTRSVEIAGVSFTIGFWPPRESERIAAGIKAVKAHQDHPDSQEARDLALEVHRRCVRYGVRGWEKWEGGPDASAAIETEEIYGVKHQVLSEPIVHALYINDAIWPLAMACIRWNNLDDEEKKRSDAPSESQDKTPDTHASGASQDSAANRRGKTKTGTGT